MNNNEKSWYFSLKYYKVSFFSTKSDVINWTFSKEVKSHSLVMDERKDDEKSRHKINLNR